MLQTLKILLYVTGAAFSASIKGGTNGTKGRWDPPKDWDWSVTPGRLIPVSEATDDVPTPGYRMSQLQQRIPPHHELQPFPVMDVAVNNTTAEEGVVVIGQKQPPAEVTEGKITNDLPTTQGQETTENLEHHTPKEVKPQQALDEQELILLNDEPIVYQRESVSFESQSTTEKVPVVEEPMEKVELPEICSISGLGCRDPKPVPQEPDVATTPEVEEHTEVLKHPKVVPHPHVASHPEVQKGEEDAATTEHPTTKSMDHQTVEEHTTNHDQLPSGSFQIDQQVVQQVLPISTSSEATVDETLYNNTSVSVPSNETNSQETVVMPQYNFTVPAVVHSVISSVSEQIGYSNTTKHEADSTTNVTDHVVDDAQVQLQQQEQQVQQEVYSSAQIPQEAEVHQVDEQKLLEIANSWGSSSENSSTHSLDRRMDGTVKEEAVTETVMKEDLPNQEAVSAGQEMKEMTQQTEHKNSTESPSIGDRIESYWKAATGYVSKALNL